MGCRQTRGRLGGHDQRPALARQVRSAPGDHRVPLLRGRVFTPADRGPPYVVVINEAFARTYFKGHDPVGQRIAFDRVPSDGSTWRTIVGVVGDEHQSTPATPVVLEAMAPFAQEASPQMSIVARTRSDPMTIAPPMRRVDGP